MVANLATASIKALSAATSRTLATHLGDVVNVRDYGAVGDGVANDGVAIAAALAVALNQPSGNGINYHLNRPVYFPAGIYKVTAPITIFNSWGVHLYGAGMTSTVIQNVTASSTVLALNGVGYSTFEHMRLEADAGGIACDYDWDGTGAVGGQLNTFYKMSFGSIGGHGLAAFGCKVGYSGWQCDTSSWIDCLYGADVGLGIGNLNAISHRVVGGNFQGCRIGIYVQAGAIQEIAGVGFQESSEWDIKISGGAGDATHISGISTESTNFVWCQTLDCAVTIIACAQRSNPGVFANAAGVLNIEGCLSKGGTVGGGCVGTIKNSQFWRIDAVDTYPFYPHTLLKLENTLFGIDEGSVARREIDTTVTSAGKRTRGVEGTSLAADSVVNTGVWTGGNATTFSPISISIASPAVVSSSSWFNTSYNRHGFVVGTPVAFATTGALPTGLNTATTYYVLAAGLTGTTFRISTSPGGTAVNTSGSQSGVHSLYLVRVFAVGDQILKSNVTAGGSPGWICTTAGPALGGAVFAALANTT